MQNKEEQMVNGLTQKQTPVEWLMEKLYKKGFLKEADSTEPIHLMNQAKEMRRQEIINAYKDGNYDNGMGRCEPEQYYDKTFKK